jgi:hypothetical protein|nr:MAG TPA: hypothetical protein [Caudoviricetes sp.]
MAEEKPKTGYCGPSQVTINIGTSGVKINDEGKPQGGLDPAQYVTRKDFLDALELRPTRDQVETQIAGVRTDAANASAASVAAKATSEEARARAASADGASSEAVTKVNALSATVAATPRLLRLDRGALVPEGTPVGTIIVRSTTPISGGENSFPPVTEWPGVTAPPAGDGVIVDKDHTPLHPAPEQMRSAKGTWDIEIRYSYHGSGEGDEEAMVPLRIGRLWAAEDLIEVRRGEEFVKFRAFPGDNKLYKAKITPMEVDKHIGMFKFAEQWGPYIEAPTPGKVPVVIHDIKVAKAA